ncbi:hypothetical protein BGX24_004697 [Mortierella sp. AD032]|nr:hypothetical protein BGX24_004697 [Mortierella sp. AD032]
MNIEASEDEHLDDDSGSEEEELVDGRDDGEYDNRVNDNDKGAQGDTSQSLQPGTLSLSDRGLSKSVNYVWLVEQLVSCRAQWSERLTLNMIGRPLAQSLSS